MRARAACNPYCRMNMPGHLGLLVDSLADQAFVCSWRSMAKERSTRAIFAAGILILLDVKMPRHRRLRNLPPAEATSAPRDIPDLQ